MHTSSLWLDLVSLVRRCDTPSYARGLELYRIQRVLGLRIEPLKGYWLLMGEVQSSARNPYQVSIELKHNPSGDVLDCRNSNCGSCCT